MPKDPILALTPLGFTWQTADPFLFCVHHDDAYPAGNERMGPAASLDGRELGQDFEGRDGWRMYHGEEVPGFPAHPHRGFETVTIVRKGLIDHSDSLGAAARFGGGDVQWLTAGKGVVHSEMFPLLDRSAGNPLELFQIWLNLPSVGKLCEPHFTMFWREQIPRVNARDAQGRLTEIDIIAGELPGHPERPLPPPPASWAARPDSALAIWTIKVSPGAQFTLPAAAPGINRSLYFFKGSSLRAGGEPVPARHGMTLRSDAALELETPTEAGAVTDACELLLLQGRPIAEPVAQYGPFVMNTRAEIQQAFLDYQRTQFGGWPWKDQAPVHAREEPRFARHADGRVEKAGPA